jgi:hypothetical protein
MFETFPRRLLAGVLILTFGSAAAWAQPVQFEVHATLKKVDPARRALVVAAGQQERNVRVPEGVKVFDAAGKELADGLAAKELREGTSLTLTVRREGGRPVLATIRVGSKSAAAATPAGAPGPVAQQDTSALTPLTDLGLGKYHGFAGGLYPEGKNARPAGHESAGIALARQIQPLDAAGKPSADGKIVLLGIGFSNTVQAFSGFMEVAAEDRTINPRLLLVNGAVGGMAAFMIQDPDDGKTGTKYWSIVDDRLKAAGATRAQVQVVWIKETDPVQQQAGGFPKYIENLQAELTNIVGILPKRFPQVKLAYLSSRTYGGWAKPRADGGGPGNSEPFSYESGFAAKWLIERQIQGDSALAFDATKGAVKSPWLSWAAYLWTNGKTPRGDGMFFVLDDYQEKDRMHESPAGQRKVGRMLVDFFKGDATTKGWFVR